ncbi:MAG: DUF2851 family protein, partial [Nitrospinota bacterium]|nr:DUF2851 family protein [Nitrospinota bacterium]
IKGDVELHVHASDWKRHKHHQDPAYGGVRLHVAMYCDILEPCVTTLGQSPVELELSKAFPAWPQALRLDGGEPGATKEPSPRLGLCGSHFQRIGATRMMDILDAAGEGRLILKSEKISRLLKRDSGEETLYRGLMEVMGYSTFRSMFHNLAMHLPLGLLRPMVAEMDRKERQRALEAVLLGVSGLLPQIDSTMDGQTQAYLDGALSTWGQMKEKFGLDRLFGRQDWKLAGARPANYPMGRLAAMSNFLASHLEGNLETLFKRLLQEFPENGGPGQRQHWLEKVSGMFAGATPGYWAHRHTLGGRQLAKPRALVSADRASLFMINVAIPHFLARALEYGAREEEARLRAIAYKIPKSGGNSILKYMTLRLFSGKTPRGRMDAVKEQGMMQIYADFCLMDAGDCQGCALADYLARQEPCAPPMSGPGASEDEGPAGAGGL